MDQAGLLSQGSAPTRRRLRMAGYLAMASAFMAIPWFLFTFHVADLNNMAFRIAEASMLMASLALLVYLLVTFQQLLNRCYAFQHANKTISLIIQANVTLTANSLLGLAVPELGGPVRIMGFILVVIAGILQMMFGIWLLQLPSSLGGLHRPYCYLNVITGFAYASVVLLPLGMVTNCIVDIMLGTIFMQASLPKPGTE